MRSVAVKVRVVYLGAPKRAIRYAGRSATSYVGPGDATYLLLFMPARLAEAGIDDLVRVLGL